MQRVAVPALQGTPGNGVQPGRRWQVHPLGTAVLGVPSVAKPLCSPPGFSASGWGEGQSRSSGREHCRRRASAGEEAGTSGTSARKEGPNGMDLAVTCWAGPQVVGTGKEQPLHGPSTGLKTSQHGSHLPEKFLLGLEDRRDQHPCVLLGTGQGLGTHMPEAAGTDAP